MPGVGTNKEKSGPAAVLCEFSVTTFSKLFAACFRQPFAAANDPQHVCR